MESDPTAIPLEFDPMLHRMVGTTYHGDIDFDVPFISEIVDGLYMGGCQDGLNLPAGIKHIVSLYPWEGYAASKRPRSALAVWMQDSEEQKFDQVLGIARWVNACRRDAHTLVHCQAGLNRSGLIVATALVLDGMIPSEAIALLREKRSPAVLCNPSFEQYVLDLHKNADLRRTFPGPLPECSIVGRYNIGLAEWSIACSCGRRFDGETVEEATDAWDAHRAAVPVVSPE